jgi:hypothetical protein
MAYYSGCPILLSLFPAVSTIYSVRPYRFRVPARLTSWRAASVVPVLKSKEYKHINIYS